MILKFIDPPRNFIEDESVLFFKVKQENNSILSNKSYILILNKSKGGVACHKFFGGQFGGHTCAKSWLATESMTNGVCD